MTRGLYTFFPKTCEDEKIIFSCGSLMDVPRSIGYQGSGKPMAIQMELTRTQLDLFRAVLETLGAKYYYDMY